MDFLALDFLIVVLQAAVFPVGPVLFNHPVSVLNQVGHVVLNLLSVDAGLLAAVEKHAHEAKDNCIQLCGLVAHHERFRTEEC